LEHASLQNWYQVLKLLIESTPIHGLFVKELKQLDVSLRGSIARIVDVYNQVQKRNASQGNVLSNEMIDLIWHLFSSSWLVIYALTKYPLVELTERRRKDNLLQCDIMYWQGPNPPSDMRRYQWFEITPVAPSEPLSSYLAIFRQRESGRQALILYPLLTIGLRQNVDLDAQPVRDIFIFNQKQPNRANYVSTLHGIQDYRFASDDEFQDLETLFSKCTIRVLTLQFDWSNLANLSWLITRDEIRRLESKYLRNIYVQRDVEKTILPNFINSNISALAIVGDAGSGKTSLLCHLAETCATDDIVLLYRAEGLADHNLAERVTTDLTGNLPNAGDIDFQELLKRLDRTRTSGRMFVLIDAINEYPAKLEDLVVGIMDLAAMASQHPWCKIVFTCRTAPWNTLKHRIIFRTDLLYSYKNQIEVPLTGFSDEEFEAAYELYRAKYHVVTPYMEILAEPMRKARKLLTDPLMLRIVCETYHNQGIPWNVTSVRVLDKYISELVSSQQEKEFLYQVIQRMRTKNPPVDYLIIEKDLWLNESLREFALDNELSSPYTRLLSAGILREAREAGGDGKEGEPHCYRPLTTVGFTYDRVHEYLIAEHEFKSIATADSAVITDRLYNLIQESKSYRPIWGAVKWLLLLIAERRILD
jgi:hypothetical protein